MLGFWGENFDVGMFDVGILGENFDVGGIFAFKSSVPSVLQLGTRLRLSDSL